MPDQKRPTVRRGRDTKKRLRTYLLQVSPDDTWFRMRRVDFPSLFFEGLIPSPLLTAVEAFEGLRKKFREEDAAQALMSIDNEQKASFMELLRRCAVSSVVEPKITFSKKAARENEDLLWAGGMSDDPEDSAELRAVDHQGDVPTPVLMTIWRAVLGEAGIVTMSDNDAEEFRTGEQAHDDAPIRALGGVRREAVVVDSPSEGDASVAPADDTESKRPKVEFVGVA